MPVLTIHLSDEAHAALTTVAEASRRSIDEVVEESLKRSGVVTEREVSSLVAGSRSAAGLPDDLALELAVAETRAARREHGHRH